MTARLARLIKYKGVNMAMIASLIGKALASIALSLATQEVAKDVIMWVIAKMVKSSKNTWDDELLEIAEAKWNAKK